MRRGLHGQWSASESSWANKEGRFVPPGDVSQASGLLSRYAIALSAIGRCTRKVTLATDSSAALALGAPLLPGREGLPLPVPATVVSISAQCSTARREAQATRFRLEVALDPSQLITEHQTVREVCDAGLVEDTDKKIACKPLYSKSDKCVASLLARAKDRKEAARGRAAAASKHERS